MGSVSGSEHVTFGHGLADADIDGFLADRDVQESRQVAGAEPLLHALFEAPDEQHLAQELAERLVVQRPSLLDLGHGDGSVRFGA